MNFTPSKVWRYLKRANVLVTFAYKLYQLRHCVPDAIDWLDSLDT